VARVEFEVRSVEFAARSCRTRIPFRFGSVTVTEAPVVVARAVVRANGAAAVGYSGDLAIPKWLEKDVAASSGDDVRALFASSERAARAFRGAAGTPFGVWLAAHQRCTQGDLASAKGLVDGFGVALVERALLDACCRAAGVAFREALARDLFAFEPAALIPEARGLRCAELVAEPAPERVLVRHTVGGLDPLCASDVPPELRGGDDHPLALEEDIARYGVRAFKLKLGGDPEADVRRLGAIARVVDGCGVRDPLFTLDANESYPDLAQVERLLERLARDPDGRRIAERLAYLEQPLPRARTLDPSTADAVRALAERVPLLIDEADDSVAAFERALAIGYRGVSVKNCKGVFRALANRALCLARGDGAFQTSEDLTNLPVLPLQQDLATLAALGLPHSERNGHHFFPGLDVVPRREAEAALAAHPDLYKRRGERITLRIREGELSLACQHATGYGYASQIAWGERASFDAVRKELPA
jgi:L-alanine-DL-glutamate epimerase-like enolase superfamily enzyme